MIGATRSEATLLSPSSWRLPARRQPPRRRAEESRLTTRGSYHRSPLELLRRCGLGCGLRRRRLEVHLRHLARSLSRFEVSIVGLKPGPPGENVVRKFLDI